MGSIASMRIQRHTELDVYKKAFDGAMNVFERSKSFPKEETYSLTDQIRRSSRSVCANLAEAWRKRRDEAASIAKLSDAEREAAETQMWLEFAVKCCYLVRATVYGSGISTLAVDGLPNNAHATNATLYRPQKYR
jgi:four helix bundle protein